MSSAHSVIPRPLSLVRFDSSRVPSSVSTEYPFRAGVSYIFLGEIPNMPGHCVVAEQQSGRLYAGYHTEHFIELMEDET
ncbi:hypothetical protein BH24BAC1_BH24BAC1_33450 [soil metagenome]